jgi:mannose-6-phosphate isomerase-like protein (cupin superfamily)
MSLGSAGTTSIRLALANPGRTEALASVRLVVPRSYAVNLPAATPSEWPEVGTSTAVTYKRRFPGTVAVYEPGQAIRVDASSRLIVDTGWIISLLALRLGGSARITEPRSRGARSALPRVAPTPDRPVSHTADEVYLILAGEAPLEADEASRRLRPGDAAFVVVGKERHFAQLRARLGPGSLRSRWLRVALARPRPRDL